MSVVHSQRQILLRLLAALRPHWRREAGLPSRVQQLLARHRSFGARDRRLYRELIFTTLRYLPWIEPLLADDRDEAVRIIAWLAADTAATRNFRAAFATGLPPEGDRTTLLPAWFRHHCPEIFSEPELGAQLQRAPLWLRVNPATVSQVTAEFAECGWEWQASPILPTAIQVLTEADVSKSRAYQQGHMEIQDLGSQLILESAAVAHGGHWLDACAGAGGKTLQLAAMLGSGGHVDAHDIRVEALAELSRRATRAGVADRITTLANPPHQSYDGVLVDAPCSGSGTWRRAPHLKWVTTEETITRAARQQATLLARFSAHVRPGGRLIYATCSLSAQENEVVVAGFLAANPEFKAESPPRLLSSTPRGPGWLILPGRHDTDGFFLALLRRD